VAAAPLDALERLGQALSLTSPAPTKRMLVIVNPYATTVSDRLKNLVVYALQGRYEVEAIDTQSPAHATELVRAAADEGFDVVVSFGGDGTVNEVANGLAGTDTPMTCLPGGATNVYCRLLGIPHEIVDATEHLLAMADDWRPRKVDLGQVNGRFFTFSAGLGLDASVVERVDRHPHLKARLGPYYFTYAAVTTFMRRYLIRPPRLRVEAAGETIEGVTAIVQNADPFTYFSQNRPIRVAEGAELDGGTLAGVVLRRASPIDMPTVIWRAFAHAPRMVDHRQISSFGGLEHITASSIDGRPVPLQVDGDYVADVTEAVYGIAPRALTVVS
jgi:diacylglycerol kinase family enzyme